MQGETGSYRDLVVWQQAMDLAVAVYEATKEWPREEAFGLTSQARRAASSIPPNIVEGYGRETRGAYLQFLRVAQGSLKELETHLLLSSRIGIASKEPVEMLMERTESVGKLLRLLLRRLSRA